MFSYQKSKDITEINERNIQFRFDDNIINIFYNKNYVYCNSETINLDQVNILLSVKQKVTFEEIKNIIESIIKQSYSFDIINNEDYMNLFNSKPYITKCENNKTKLLEYNETINFNKELLTQIPQGLVMDKNQRFNIIYQEIQKLNTNMNVPYYIKCNNNDPYDLSIRLKYEGELYDKLKKDNQEFFELNFILDHNLYPFVPPKVSYIKPNIDINLILNILNLDIWTTKNWNYTISLDKLVINLGNELEPYFLKYYNSNMNKSKLYNLILQFSQNINDIPFEKIKLNLDFTKCTNSGDKKMNKYWNSGVGYGTSNSSVKWDINKYINDQDIKKNNIIKHLTLINNEINNTDDYSILFSSVLFNYIFKQLKGCNILELNKNEKLYMEIINIIISLKDKVPENFNENLYINIYEICEDISTLKSNSNDIISNSLDNLYIKFLSLYEILKSQVSVKEQEIFKPSDNKIQNYLTMVEQNKFLNYKFDIRQLYYNYKNSSVSKKSIMRIISEISSLKKNLPINWDTSIVMRTSKSNLNFVSFIISGPKDTPYENGLFEFHAYFPDNYPNVVPKVLLKTTGNGSVRFNPNLYNCGKVCLSLLGTWSGDQGESWNPQLSTFLQVLISIQSLILVEQPYFNEPGWERQMHTERGKKASFDYNDERRYQTIRVAMVDMIKNPPESYETFIKEHFMHKKEEIFSKIELWINESTKYKNKMIEQYKELKTLL